MTMPEFTFDEDKIALPQGAWARAHRRTLRRNGAPVLALTQGRLRAYVYPLFTPAGYAVTSEAPTDHPHHNSLWIASDHLHALMPVGGGAHEEYTYNFYVDDVFQGRAPGRILASRAAMEPLGVDRCRITQEMEWRGPIEWAAPEGRLVARETRTLTITVEPSLHVIDVESRLAAADCDMRIGPTRHAYFNVRVAESMTVGHGGRVSDDRGRTGGAALSGADAKWVDFSGPVGGGHMAGVTVSPDPRDHAELSWFVADWGVVAVGPFRLTGRTIRRGEDLVARYRVLVHDGSADAVDLAARHASFVQSPIS
jgi:hypothetical protein